MKFVKLFSRGGNYLVVASNIAWLRTAENGQTSVGMVGSQPLLVTGTIEEVADTILNAAAAEAEPAAAPVVEAVEPEPRASPPPPAPEPVKPTLATDPVEPEPAAVAPDPEPHPEPAPAPSASAADPAPTRHRPAPRTSASLWERPTTPPDKGLKVMAGSQRMMGALD